MGDKKYYTTLSKLGTSVYEEKKSRFLGFAKNVKTEEEAIAFVKQIKDSHKDAKHNCFAYSINNNVICRCSDDGEPSGTAGMPILDTIKKSEIEDVAVVITRYFGGTLLGTGGLVRAYTEATKSAIADGEVVSFEEYTEIETTVSYSDYQKLSFELTKIPSKIEKEDFSNDVKILFSVQSQNVDKIVNFLAEISNAKAKTVILSKKFDFIRKK